MTSSPCPADPVAPPADAINLVRAALHELLARLAASGVRVTEALTEAAQDGSCEVYLSICPLVACQQPASNRPVARPEIAGDVAEAIRDVLRTADRPIKCITIATRAHREPHSHFRAVLRRMVRAGEVQHMPGNRYWLAEKARG